MTGAETSPPDELRSVGRGGALNLVGAAVATVTNLALVIIVTQLLPPSAAGVLFSVTSVFLILVTLSKLGTTTGLVWAISRSRGRGEGPHTRLYLRIAARPVMAVSMAVAVALLALAGPLSDLLVRSEQGLFAAVLRGVALFLPFACLVDVLLAAAQGLGTMRPTVLIERIGRTALQVALVTVSVLWLPRLLGLFWGMAYLPATYLAWRWVRRSSSEESRVDVAERSRRVAFWRFSAPRAVAGAAQLAIQRMDIVLVGALLGPAQAAIYTAATRFLVVGQLGAQAIAVATQPALGSLLGRGDHRAVNAVYQTATMWVVLLIWPLYLTFALNNQRVLSLFGPEYLQGRDVMLLLVVVMLFATGCGMVDMVLNMSGRSSWNLVNTLVALVVNLALDLLLIPRVGIIGAAVGWGAAIVVSNALALSQIAAVQGFHPASMGLVVVMTASVLCFGAAPAVVGIASSWDGWAVAACSVLACVPYAVLLWVARRVLRLDQLVSALRPRALTTGPQPSAR